MSELNTLIFIPTYNEVDNVQILYKQIRDLRLDVDLLFVDDHSPDGTGEVIDDLVRQDNHTFAIHRHGKLGIGSAHQDGIRWAYERGYKRLITMDCDFSHSPEYLKDFISISEAADVVVGSRYLKEGSLREWNWFRKILTRLGHFLTLRVLGMPYDATGAYRLYRLDKIPQKFFLLVQSKGYSFFFESLYALHLNQFTIKELSIHLPGRTYGHSKMTFKDALQSLLQLWRTYLKPYINKNSYIYFQPLTGADSAFMATLDPYVQRGHLSPQQVQGEWDVYWTSKKRATGFIYDAIAAFYRVCIIRPILNHFIRKHFPQRAQVLHAGCGSGQVDRDVVRWVNITAMDISLVALNNYRRTNGQRCRLLHGDIFQIPVPDASFDGVYNLGVMEHFTREEIQQILKEFKRVLKSHGRMVLLVPPEFGLSVIFLKGVHFILNRILKKNIHLHPVEISRIQSRDYVYQVYEQNGLRLVDQYFGIRDMFTYYVVVLQKDEYEETSTANIEPQNSSRPEAVQA